MSERDVVSWNAMISGCIGCGEYWEGVGLFMEMQKGDLKANGVTVVELLKACGGLMEWKCGREIHAYCLMEWKGSEIGMTLEQGANFAVGGATALNSSFLEAIGIPNSFIDTSLGVQLAWFKQALPSICGNVSDCRNLIGSSLILLGEIGGNDYIYGLVAGKHVDDVKPLVPLVIDTIASAINELIEMGARTLVVPGNFPIGCSSLLLTLSGSPKTEYDPTTDASLNTALTEMHINCEGEDYDD